MKIDQNFPLSSLSTVKIGGPASYCVHVTTEQEMIEALFFTQEKFLPFYILGKGSNTLFSDSGYQGVVILNKISFIKQLSDTIFSVGAGTNFPLLGVKTAKKGLTGLEFAAGVPASVGGAIFMNAGAFGQETVDTLKSVTFIDKSFAIQTENVDKTLFSYRNSPYQKSDKILLSATFELKKEPGARKRQLSWLEKRSAEQPLKKASCGCVFKNPQDNSAGALIEKAGLKNGREGGIVVSDLHANYFINEGMGTAEDFKNLIEIIKKQVFEKTGYLLEEEIKKA
jgi:UDP-N-acetylmuramate dehydrogenase